MFNTTIANHPVCRIGVRNAAAAERINLANDRNYEGNCPVYTSSRSTPLIRCFPDFNP